MSLKMVDLDLLPGQEQVKDKEKNKLWLKWALCLLISNSVEPHIQMHAGTSVTQTS